MSGYGNAPIKTLPFTGPALLGVLMQSAGIAIAAGAACFLVAGLLWMRQRRQNANLMG